MANYTIYALRRGSGKDDRSFPMDIADSYMDAAEAACNLAEIMRDEGFILSRMSNFILMKDEVAGFIFEEDREVA